MIDGDGDGDDEEVCMGVSACACRLNFFRGAHLFMRDDTFTKNKF